MFANKAFGSYNTTLPMTTVTEMSSTEAQKDEVKFRGNMATIHKWVTNGARFLENKESFNLHQEVSRFLQKPIESQEMSKIGTIILNDLLKLEKNGGIWGSAAYLATQGEVKPVETLINENPDLTEIGRNALLAVANFSKSIELKAYTDKGYALSGMLENERFLIVNGQNTGRHVTNGERLAAREAFHTGLVHFAIAIDRYRETSQKEPILQEPSQE